MHSTDQESDDVGEFDTLEAAVSAANEQFTNWRDHPDFTLSQWSVEKMTFEAGHTASEYARGEGVSYEDVFETQWTTAE
jgi:hypothetical protein